MFTVENFIEGCYENFNQEELEWFVHTTLKRFKLRIMNLQIGTKKTTDLYIPFRHIYSTQDIIEMMSNQLVQKNGLWVFDETSRFHKEITDIVYKTMESLSHPIKPYESVSFYYFIQGD